MVWARHHHARRLAQVERDRELERPAGDGKGNRSVERAVRGSRPSVAVTGAHRRGRPPGPRGTLSQGPPRRCVHTGRHGRTAIETLSSSGGGFVARARATKRSRLAVMKSAAAAGRGAEATRCEVPDGVVRRVAQGTVARECRRVGGAIEGPAASTRMSPAGRRARNQLTPVRSSRYDTTATGRRAVHEPVSRRRSPRRGTGR